MASEERTTRVTLRITKFGWTRKESVERGEVVVVRARRAEGARYTPLLGPYAVPDHIEAEVALGERLLVQLDIFVVDGRPGIRRVTMSAPDGRALSATETRLPLRQYTSEALELVAGELRIGDDGMPMLVAVVPGRNWPDLKFLAAAERASRSKVDDARLREVARVHDAAPPRGRIAAVAKHEGGVHPRHAQRLISLARAAGFIQKEVEK